MKYINLFDTQAAYDAAEKYYPNVSYIEATDEVVYQETDPDYYLKQYLTFEALENTSLELVVPAAVDSTYMTSISYSVDDGDNWVTTTIDNTAQTITTPTINAGGKVLWKGIGTAMAKSSSINEYSYFKINNNIAGTYNVSGNIMSLLYGDNFANQTEFPSGSSSNFPYLFNVATSINQYLLSAENLVLPATTLATYCYGSMFYKCTALTTAPALPATTLAKNCYSGMFSGCSLLTTVPELPATTLAEGCYRNMFKGCTALTTAPALPATTLANYCYDDMFKGCTALTTAPTTLPATTLKQYCYQYMFNGCTSLTTAPVLPAATLASNCYSYMFYSCTSLNYIKMLATDITAYNCLSNWVLNVAATGTFTKDASMTTLPTGASGIPENWTVVDA